MKNPKLKVTIRERSVTFSSSQSLPRDAVEFLRAYVVALEKIAPDGAKIEFHDLRKIEIPPVRKAVRRRR